MAWKFERVAGPFDGPTGGIVWDGKSILFTSVLESRLLRYDPRGGSIDEIRRFTNRTNGLALTPDGHLYGCQEGSRRVIEMKADGSAVALAATLDGHRINFPSDLTIDRAGRIWFTDPYHHLASHGPQIFPNLPHASVLRLDRHRVTHDWIVERLTFDTAAPRCLALSADERTLYVGEGDAASEAPRQLRAYPVDETGRLGSPLVLHSFGHDHRGPQRGAEGLCLDADGNIIVCAGSNQAGPGSLIYIVSPTGRILETQAFPDDCPQRCAFGGDGFDELYVTSGTGNLWRARQTGRSGLRRSLSRAGPS
jgi:gluconolactonase